MVDNSEGEALVYDHAPQNFPPFELVVESIMVTAVDFERHSFDSFFSLDLDDIVDGIVIDNDFPLYFVAYHFQEGLHVRFEHGPLLLYLCLLFRLIERRVQD